MRLRQSQCDEQRHVGAEKISDCYSQATPRKGYAKELKRR